jgi:hypothetical protein
LRSWAHLLEPLLNDAQDVGAAVLAHTQDLVIQVDPEAVVVQLLHPDLSVVLQARCLAQP